MLFTGSAGFAIEAATRVVAHQSSVIAAIRIRLVRIESLLIIFPLL